MVLRNRELHARNDDDDYLVTCIICLHLHFETKKIIEMRGYFFIDLLGGKWLCVSLASNAPASGLTIKNTKIWHNIFTARETTHSKKHV